jgi:ribose transport system ATP-binding protein
MTADEIPALAVGSVSKRFPGTLALDAASLRIRRGEVHALVGQNGSGKSTLIKILAGFHMPEPGASATILGREFKLGDPPAAMEAGLRFVHQDLGLVDEMDTVDNLAMGFGFDSGPGGRIRWRAQTRRARQAIGELGHDFDVRVPIGALLPAERMTVAIARALQNWQGRATVLVLDEPTSVMPDGEIRRLFDVIARVTSQGIAVLYVSHRLGEVLEIADRVTVLRDGRTFGPLDASGLSRREIVRLMTGDAVDRKEQTERKDGGQRTLVVDGLAGRALRHVDVDVHAGEIVGIAGLTGSGRDEVCGLVFGARPRAAGSVRVDGVELPASRPDVMVRHSVGLVPANRHADGLITAFSVKENLTISRLADFRRMLTLRRGLELTAAAEWIRRLGIKTHGPSIGVDTLSGGNQQKVVLGKWLRLKPAVLLLDEPTQGVDVVAKAEIHTIIERVAADGAAVLVASSDEEELERLCSRVLVLADGHVAAEIRGKDVSVQRIVALTLGIDEQPSPGRD